MDNQLSTITNHQALPAPTIQWGAILSLFWRGRWLTLTSILIGLAGAVYLVKTNHAYESHSKLLVKYVKESNAIDSIDRSLSDIAESGQTEGASLIINNEVEILVSNDIIGNVGRLVGFDRIVPDSDEPVTEDDVIGAIRKTLYIAPIEKTSVIALSFSHKDKAVTRDVLEKLLQLYKEKHLQIHRPAGVEHIKIQTQEVQERLSAIDTQIHELMNAAGIVSSQINLDVMEQRRSELRTQLYRLESEVAASEAKLLAVSPEFVNNSNNGSASYSSSVGAKPSLAVIQQYQDLLSRSADLRARSLQLASKFTSNSNLVGKNRALIQSIEQQRQSLVRTYPSLVSKVSLTRQEEITKNTNISNQIGDLSALKARKTVLENQLREFESTIANLPSTMSQLKRLETNKAEEERTLSFLQTSLQKALANAALDSSKVTNLKVVEEPSIPEKMIPATTSLLIKALAGGGLFFGLLFVFVREKFLIKKVQRPEDIESHFGIPVDSAVPFIGKARPGVPGIDCYARDIIDLISNGWGGDKQFGPKMLGVTGVGKGAGATTIANNLAHALRKQGEKVLVLSYQGAEGQSLDNNFIKTLENDLHDEFTLNDSVLEARRFKLMPAVLSNFKYDYVIFDMPLTGPGIPTKSISGLFHKVLLVVSPDASNRDDLVETYNELISAEANVSCVFNKERVNPKKPRTFKSRAHIRTANAALPPARHLL